MYVDSMFKGFKVNIKIIYPAYFLTNGNRKDL